MVPLRGACWSIGRANKFAFGAGGLGFDPEFVLFSGPRDRPLFIQKEGKKNKFPLKIFDRWFLPRQASRDHGPPVNAGESALATTPAALARKVGPDAFQLHVLCRPHKVVTLLAFPSWPSQNPFQIEHITKHKGRSK